MHLFLTLSLLSSLADAREAPQPAGQVYTVIVGPSYEDVGQPSSTAGAGICRELGQLFATDVNALALCGNENTRRERIVPTIATTIKRMTDDDTMVLIWIGSGWTDDADQTYLLPSDYIAGQLADTSIPTSMLIDQLRALEGRGQVTILIDAVHADTIHWEDQGVYTIGPSAKDFDGAPNNVTVFSATQWQYTSDDALFGSLLVRAFTGEADADNDGALTHGELRTFLDAQIKSATDGQQMLGALNAPGELSAKRLVVLPGQVRPSRERDMDLSALRKPTRYGGIGLIVAGCAAATIGRVIATSAYDDLAEGNYAGRGEYDTLTNRYNTGAVMYTPGLITCGAGGALITTSFVIGERTDVRISPFGFGGRF